MLLALEDAGAPSFDRRAGESERPSELRTSDRKSMMRFMGCPLNLFGGVSSLISSSPALCVVLIGWMGGVLGCIFSAIYAFAAGGYVEERGVVVW